MRETNATCQHCGARFQWRPGQPACPNCGTTENRMESESKQARQWNRAQWQKRTIGGKEINFPNKMEANYYRYLWWLYSKEEIEAFRYQPKPAFDFRPKYTRGTTSYKPDFEVDTGHEIYYVETKGYMDPKSKTKLKRMAELFPDVRVEVVLYRDYQRIARTIGPMIEGWE